MDRVPYTVCPLGVHTSDFQIRPDEAAPYRDDGYFFNTPGKSPLQASSNYLLYLSCIIVGTGTRRVARWQTFLIRDIACRAD
eukprot:1191099-Prorocentrum_minimum.AAC.10